MRTFEARWGRWSMARTSCEALPIFLRSSVALQGDAVPVDLRRAVVAIQSAAMQVIMTGALAVGLSERLATVAALDERTDS